ncbi:hypothetical protein [Nostoc sp.]
MVKRFLKVKAIACERRLKTINFLPQEGKKHFCKRFIIYTMT